MSSKAILFLGILLAVMALVSSGVSATEATMTSDSRGQNTNMVTFEDVTNYGAPGDGEKYLDGKWLWWWPGFFGHGWYPQGGKGDVYDKGGKGDGYDKGYGARKVGYFGKGEKIGVDGASATKPLNTYSGGKKGSMVAFEDMAKEATGDRGKYLDDKTWFWWPFLKWWGVYGHGLYSTSQKGEYFDKMGEKMDVEGATATKPLN